MHLIFRSRTSIWVIIFCVHALQTVRRRLENLRLERSSFNISRILNISQWCDTSVIDLLVHYDLSALIFSVLFTMLGMHLLLCSSLIFSLLFELLTLLISSLLAPLFSLCSSPLRYYCSTLICHIFLHFPSLRSTPIWSDHPPQLFIIDSDCSTHYPL